MVSKLRRLVLFAGLIPAVVILAAGCAARPAQEDQFTKEMKQKFAEMNDPKASVGKVRAYALQKLPDMSDEESDILSNNAPVIGRSYDESEYSFTWKGPKGERNIEVVTTPAPFEPIAVFRVTRVYYP